MAIGASDYIIPTGAVGANETTFENIDTLIQGKPITVFIVMHSSELILHANISDYEKFIKEKLAVLLAKEIMESKLCEFTKERNLHNQIDKFRARAFLTPDNQVRILRKEGKI